MAHTNLATFKSARDNPNNRARSTRANTSIAALGRYYSSWKAGGDATGATPTTAAVPTNASTGALGNINTSGIQRILKILYSHGFDGAGKGGMVTIADRLSHQGGLSGTATGAQTTNLPTAALTRQTSGVGVWAMAEIYSTIGTSGATATVSYTNSGGTSGRTSEAFNWGVAGFNGAPLSVIVPLQVGDKGVKSVESFTASGNTGTAGNFGITLAYPLLSFPTSHANTIEFDALEDLTWFAQVVDNACLYFLIVNAYTATGVCECELSLGEDA